MKANDYAWLSGAEDVTVYCPKCMKEVKKHPSITHCLDCGSKYESESPTWWKRIKKAVESDRSGNHE